MNVERHFNLKISRGSNKLDSFLVCLKALEFTFWKTCTNGCVFDVFRAAKVWCFQLKQVLFTSILMDNRALLTFTKCVLLKHFTNVQRRFHKTRKKRSSPLSKCLWKMRWKQKKKLARKEFFNNKRAIFNCSCVLFQSSSLCLEALL